MRVTGQFRVESFGGDLWIRVHAEEEAHVEHSLNLFNFKQVAHVFNQFALKLISTLFVAAHCIALLR